MPRKNAEGAIQRALVRWIRDKYGPFVRVHATMNEDSRTQAAMGIDIGIPDLLIFYHVGDVEHIFYLELKTKTGCLSKSQKYWVSKYVKSSNTDYAVAYGFSEAKEKCQLVLDRHKRYGI